MVVEVEVVLLVPQLLQKVVMVDQVVGLLIMHLMVELLEMVILLLQVRHREIMDH
jgi:hypothetical protein|tara:strand:- start:1214 stop:1378 length:165 start_codon:yes stop_codon:yes gene_type:complete